ncbi:hypothetical protein D3C85_1888690 [compost metagenome]
MFGWGLEGALSVEVLWCWSDRHREQARLLQVLLIPVGAELARDGAGQTLDTETAY